MLSKLHSAAFMTIEALPREIEVDCAEHGFEKAAIACPGEAYAPSGTRGETCGVAGSACPMRP
ncbi:MAG TPA: hypothetical protein PLL20_08225 [Phycisphaerae bacterium]|jgi:hypothetical protein|nr:hypothetical protein [Phycisphaerae bacterium]HRR85454.1 hypothetical protein [Phycisphaerae bacterium]